MRAVPVPSGCWEWMGARNSHGYGQISVGGQKVYVHRWAYEQHVGPIPEGTELDHRCDNPPCCNPGHLRPLTHAENVGRAYDSETCKRGHPRTEENTQRRVDGRVAYCKPCRNERRRR